MKCRFIVPFLILLPLAVSAQEVKITKNISAVTVIHNGKSFKIQRNQNTNHRLRGSFTKTSRPCPPFCFQPMSPAPGVHTMGEVELVAFLQNRQGILIDARTATWYKKGTIPSAINIPFTAFDPDKAPKQIVRALKKLGAQVKQKKSGFFASVFSSNDHSNWDFSKAKDLALFCNGPWCGQSPLAIQNLITIGYPANKLYYYRGGMQMWKMGGFTTIKPKTGTAWR